MNSGVVHLESAGTAVLIEIPTHGLPRVLHWGEDLGPLSASDLAAAGHSLSRQTRPGTLDAAWQVGILPQEGDGWSGRPGLQLRRDGVLHRPRWEMTDVVADRLSCQITARDAAADLELTHTIVIGAGGIVTVDCTLAHRGSPTQADVEIDWLEATLPVPTTTDYLTTFDGRWTREKRPVTTRMPAGSVSRQSRRGRPGHDAPTLFIASEGEPQWPTGRAWSAHVAWPGDSTYRTDRVTDSVTLIGGGELLRPGEVVLRPGETYSAPQVLFAHSTRGLDGIAAQAHDWLRARPQHPRSPRPLTLNTWEAVYFDHDPARLMALAERAASVGVERFVLDDGWFRGRRDDTTSLGDWIVDRTVWPEGLQPLADRVHQLGMQFGLWFEPEMVSLDSDLARSHPDWLLHDPAHLAHESELSWRTQYVLDLANPGAYAHVLDQMDALVSGLGIDAIKWDHNRDLVDSLHDCRPGVHAHTLATLALIAELKRRHPRLEIESCSSGGARTDLGILSVTDRVWASDSNDPVERQDIQRWTGLLLPPELVGAHVGPTRAHSSGRVTVLSYRMATSLMGSAGFEWDILECDDDDTAAIRRFGALYKELRPVIHTGIVVHPVLRDPAWRVTGYIEADGVRAVIVVATVASLEDARAERLRIPHLNPLARYRVRVRREIGDAEYGWIAPEWFTGDGIVVPGSVLERVGLQLPTLWPVQAFVIELTAVPPVQ